MTLTTLELASVEHLDFDPACDTVTCEFGRPKATHILWGPCGCERLACTGCAKTCAQVRANAMARRRILYCRVCEAALEPSLCRIEPLP